MLTLTITALAAIYMFGPALWSRVITNLVVPRRKIQQSRSEEVIRAILFAVVPLFLAIVWAAHSKAIRWSDSILSAQTLYSGLASEKFFGEHRPEFFRSAAGCARFNWSISWRLYTILTIFCVGVDCALMHYGVIRNSRPFRNSVWLKKALATVVMPRVSEWHVLLTSFASARRNTEVYVDVLTTSGILYRGKVEDSILSLEGKLTAVLLSSPSRFDRESFLRERANNQKPDKELFWKPIPGSTFLISMDCTETINVRHFDPVADETFKQELGDLLDLQDLVITKWRAILEKNGPITPASEEPEP